MGLMKGIEYRCFQKISQTGEEYSLQPIEEQRGSKVVLQSKPKHFMSEEEKKHDTILYDFYRKLSNTLTKSADSTKIAMSQVANVVENEIESIGREEEKMNQQFDEYERALRCFNNYLNEYDRALERYRKMVAKFDKIKQPKAKDKEKLREKRHEFDEMVAQYETVEKLVAFIEEQSRSEFQYQRSLSEVRFIRTLHFMVLKYKEMYENGAKIFADLAEKENSQAIVDGFVDSERHEVLHIKKPRGVYSFRSLTRIVGVPIKSVLARPHETFDIPKAIMMAFNHVREHIDTVGIFRKSGKKLQVDKLISLMDDGNFGLLEEYWTKEHLHTVCSAIKEYIKRLPKNFCPWDNFTGFGKLNTIPEKSNFIKMVFKRLDTCDQIMLLHIFDLMHEVDEHNANNLMTAENLANVVSINIFKKDMTAMKQDPQALMLMGKLTQDMKAVMLHTILDHSYIFEKRPQRPIIPREIGVHANPIELKLVKEKYMYGQEEKRKLPVGRNRQFNLFSIIRNNPLPLEDMIWKEGDEKGKIDYSNTTEKSSSGGGSGGARKKKSGESEMLVNKKIDSKDKIELLVDLNDTDMINKDFIVVGDEQGFIKCYQVSRRLKMSRREGFVEDPVFEYRHSHTHGIQALLIVRADQETPKESLIVTAGKDGIIRVWDCFPENTQLDEKLKDNFMIEHECFEGSKLDILKQWPGTTRFVVVIGKKFVGFDATDFGHFADYKEQHFHEIDSIFTCFGHLYTFSREGGKLIEWMENSLAPVREYDMGDKIQTAFPVTNEYSKTAAVVDGQLIKFDKFDLGESYFIEIEEISGTAIRCGILLNPMTDKYVLLGGDGDMYVVSGINGFIKKISVKRKVVGLKRYDKEKWVFWNNENVTVFSEDTWQGSFKLDHPVRNVEILKDKKCIIMSGGGGSLMLWNFVGVTREIKEYVDEEELQIKMEQRKRKRELMEKQSRMTYDERLRKMQEEIESKGDGAVVRSVEMTPEEHIQRRKANLREKLKSMSSQATEKKDDGLSEEERRRLRREKRRKRREERLSRQDFPDIAIPKKPQSMMPSRFRRPKKTQPPKPPENRGYKKKVIDM